MRQGKASQLAQRTRMKCGSLAAVPVSGGVITSVNGEKLLFAQRRSRIDANRASGRIPAREQRDCRH